jgi:hypothetical protein
MSKLSIRRKPSKKQRAARMAGKAGRATATFMKARLVWLAGKKATKVAAPAVAVGTAAVVARKRGNHRNQSPAAA